MKSGVYMPLSERFKKMLPVASGKYLRLAAASAALGAISACTGTTEHQDAALRSASIQCVAQYPMQAGTMVPQESCLTAALDAYGPGAYGQYFKLAELINAKREGYWQQADRNEISVSAAQAAFLHDRDAMLTQARVKESRQRGATGYDNAGDVATAFVIDPHYSLQRQ